MDIDGFIKNNLVRRDSMLCHMIIDLSNLLCTRSDEWKKKSLYRDNK